ncbi:hypothetical protein BDFG_09380, partial [Blastomyces dermatitidis ATCC 26199]
IKLLRATVSEIKLSLRFSLNDHIGSYIIMLIEKRGSITTAAERAENRPDTDALTSRRNDISLQGIATTITAAREAEGGVTMKAVLPRLIDTAAFNLAFLTVTETAAAS